MYTLNGWWFLSSGGSYPPVFTVAVPRAQLVKCYSPRHLDFEVLNEIQPFFLLFEFPQQIMISYEPNQSLMQSKL